jgi:hypothetical protein
VDVSGDELLERLDRTIRFVVEQDLPWLAAWEREQLVGHLTGAVFVTLPRDDEPEGQG